MKALIKDLESLNYSKESIPSESLQEYLINTIQLLDSIKEFELKSSSHFNDDIQGNSSFYEIQQILDLTMNGFQMSHLQSVLL